MSRLARKLNKALLEIRGKKPSLYDFLLEKYDDAIHFVKDKLYYYEIKWFFRNLPHFLKQAWYYRDFDEMYSIECFAQNLDRLAGGLKRYSNHVNTQKCYRRCKYAAHLLRQAYDGMYSIDDKSYTNWTKNNRMFFGDCLDEESNKRGLKQMCYRRKYPEEYSNKMWKVIHKRTSAVEKQRKKEAWEYIHKHIEKFWD